MIELFLFYLLWATICCRLTLDLSVEIYLIRTLAFVMHLINFLFFVIIDHMLFDCSEWKILNASN